MQISEGRCRQVEEGCRKADERRYAVRAGKADEVR